MDALSATLLFYKPMRNLAGDFSLYINSRWVVNDEIHLMATDDIPLQEDDWKALPPQVQEQVAEIWQRVQRLETENAQLRQELDLVAAPKRVLVVDDSPIVRTTVGQLVVKSGHELTEANDGDEALELAREQDFDLIILDLHMPNKNGVETLKELRELQRHKETAIVMLTTETDRRIVQGVSAYKVSGYVVKESWKVMAEKLGEFLKAR